MLTEEWMKRGTLLASALGHSKRECYWRRWCLPLSQHSVIKERESRSLRPVCQHSIYTGQPELHRDPVSTPSPRKKKKPKGLLISKQKSIITSSTAPSEVNYSTTAFHVFQL